MPDGNDCEACGGHACVQMIDPDDDRPVIDRDDISEDIDW
jgi:hypothetical protein